MTRRTFALALTAITSLAMLVACPKDKPPVAADAGADVGAPEASAALTRIDGDALVTNACLSCHSREMLAQQRLTQAQWSKVVTKMVGWGSTLEPHEVAPLVAYLTATFPPDAGTYEPTTLTAAEALEELAPLDDGPFAGGDAERGRPLYTDRCSGCHGPEARGHIGVSLVDRPILYRAPDVASLVRRGRGKMIPMPLSDAEIADVLAYLRRLRNPAP